MIATDLRQVCWQHALFRTLPEEQLELLADHCRIEVLKRHERLFQAQDFAKWWFIVQKGLIKCHVWHEKPPRDVVKGLFGPGELIGEEALTLQPRYVYEAQALCDTTVLAIPRKATRALAHNNAEWMWTLMQAIGKKLQLAERQIQALSSSDARGRVVFFIRDLAQRHGRPIGKEVLVKHYLTQQEIAEATGTSRQTVTSLLNEWRKQNLVYFTRHSILIRDLDLLR